jgi:phosphatidylinositol alpha-1,6-mannosyltransferase
MKTLLLAPELFRSEGGISRILRLYLRALCDLAGPADGVGYVALNDEKTENGGRKTDGGCLKACDRDLWCAVGCGRSKARFVLSAWRHVMRTDRVVCGHLHQFAVLWLLAWLRPGLKIYLVAHGIEVWRPYSWLEWHALRRAERILCVSEYTRRQMLRFHSALEPARLVIVPNTFDPGFDGKTEGGKAPEGDVALAASRHPVILVVARLAPADAYKGVDTMIEAMPQILRDFTGARLRIVGGGDDQPRLAALVRSLGLDHAVHFTGVVDDAVLRREYEACDLFALPSRKEGFGLVYLEAMNSGRPCLAARAGGAPEVVNEEVGALVEYGNIDQIALAVADLVRHPRDAAAMRRRAAEFAFPEFKRRLGEALGK